MSEVPPPAPIQVGSGGTPGGYRFEPGQVDAVINQWKDLRRELTNDIKNAQAIAWVKPPGQEFASGDFVNTGAKLSGNTLLEQHQKMAQYVDNYIKALEEASGKIKSGEQQATDAVKSQGKGF
jgi:hypothetical protein